MDSKTTIKKAGCFLGHHQRGVLVHIREGKVVKVPGNPKHPSRGFICETCVNAPKWLYHQDQLKRVLKRTRG